MTPFNDLANAISFLEEQCNYLVVQIEIQPALWKIVSLDGLFDKVFTASEILGFARHRCSNAWCLGELGETASAWPRFTDFEIIRTSGGLILRGISPATEDIELICDSEEELIHFIYNLAPVIGGEETHYGAVTRQIQNRPFDRSGSANAWENQGRAA